MGNFFHGWRRKVGTLTLLLACVVMGGRFRSSAIQDTITIGSGSSVQFKLISVSHRLVVAKVSTEGDEYPLAPLWLSEGAREDSWDLSFRFSDWVCATVSTPLTRDLYSFGGGPTMRSDTASCVVTACQFPYWFIDIPLTVISAFLFLSKPRKSASMKITEPGFT